MSRVPDSMVITFAHWTRHRADAICAIRERFTEPFLAVRSNTDDEDNLSQSQAGHFKTELNVAGHSADNLARAIDAVFHSYAMTNDACSVLVQPMVDNVRACYVASTHMMEDLAPYYVLSFGGGRDSTVVTNGTQPVTTIYVARNEGFADLDDDCREVLRALQEVERIIDEPFETEMVLNGTGAVLLQVRPIVLRGSTTIFRSSELAHLRAEVRRELAFDEETDVCGSRRLYGQMPDWNPAELLGAHPKPLALSLFRYLISRESWREARSAFGYRKIGKSDLLREFAGRPYVDVRLSFNSLLPAGLDAACGARLVDAWSARLHDAPGLHDKVEFDVASTIVDFDFERRHLALYPHVFDRAELRDYRARLLTVTKACLDASRLQFTLDGLRICRSDLGANIDTPRALTRLLEHIRVHAARPFAQVARQAFAAEALLRSAVRRGALDAARLATMRARIPTVVADLLDAWSSLGACGDEGEMLVGRFGHLRPGTFEISVPTYAARGKKFFSATAPRIRGHHAPFAWTATERADIDALCRESGIDFGAEHLLRLYAESVQAREYGKFVLSHAVSLLLERIADHGKCQELDRDTLAWLTVDRILDADTRTVELLGIAAHARRRHEAERSLRLPALLDAHDDLRVVRCLPCVPNFQGRGVVEGRILEVGPHTNPSSLPLRSIVAMEAADPGYDWIFSRRPTALITAYGGPNSHMAIRCGEMRCGAVLGYGVENFRRLLQATRVAIDFDSGTLGISG
jgi:hypothetical protein